MTPFLAIDPGASGGLVWRDADGIVHAEPMPDGMTAQVNFLRSLVAGLPGLTAIMEKVGTYVPGNHVGSACTFARHCGHLEASLYALGIPFAEVASAVWTRKLETLSKEKPQVRPPEHLPSGHHLKLRGVRPRRHSPPLDGLHGAAQSGLIAPTAYCLLPQGVDGAVVAADIDHAVAGPRRADDATAERLFPQQFPGCGIQRVQVSVPRAKIHLAVRHGR